MTGLRRQRCVRGDVSQGHFWMLSGKWISGGKRISVLRRRKIVALNENRDLGWGDRAGRARKLRIKLIVLVIDWT